MANRLEYDWMMWRGSLGAESTADYSNDRRTVTFRAALSSSPPVYEWALTFGDIIHNYRSALDALTWAMAHLDGNTPSKGDAHKIYFPMKKNRESFWATANSTLKSVPRDIIERLQKVQPYHVPPGHKIEDGIALILNQLDIDDKHKAALDVRTIAADHTHFMMAYRFENHEAVASSAYVEEEWIAGQSQLQDGDPVLRCISTHPIEAAEIDDLPLRLTTFSDAQGRDVFELLRLIDQQVAQTFAVVETGEFRAEWGDPEPVQQG